MFFFLFSPTETNCGPTSVSVPVRSSWWCSSEVDHQHTTTPPRPTGRPGEKESNRCRDVRQQVCVHTTSSSQLENPYLKLKKKKKYIYFSKVFYFAFCLLCAFLLKNFYFEKHFATFVLREGIIVIFPKTKFMNKNSCPFYQFLQGPRLVQGPGVGNLCHPRTPPHIELRYICAAFIRLPSLD